MCCAHQNRQLSPSTLQRRFQFRVVERAIIDKQAPSAVTVTMIGRSCRSLAELAFARFTGIWPVVMTVAVVSTIASRTSMMTTNGMTLI